MNKLVARQRLVMTFTFFSMFFGAGNLIFPPFVGAQAGSATIPAAIGFIVSAVGLPILGVLAVTFAGGFDKLAGRVSPKFALFLGLAIMLTIGPCFAIPRTATTSFEMMVAPFVPSSYGWLAHNSSTRSCSSHWRSCSPSIPKNSPKCSADSWDRCCWC